MDPRALIGILFIIQLTVACDSNKLFFGSINESFPLHVEKNGIYIKQSFEHDGFPVWKHESLDFYLYHVSGNILPTAYWVIGESLGSLSVAVSIQTFATSPELAEEKWRIWSEENVLWKPQRHLSVTCKEETFARCDTGRVRLHGLSPWNYHQHNRTGVYLITDQTYQTRPVYRHKHGDDFLYYVDGLWMVGPEVGRVSAAIFVLDYAWRPEFITDSWIVFDGEHLQRDTRLQLTCAGHGNGNHPSSPSHDVIDISDVIDVAEGMLGEKEESSIPVCDEAYCLHGGKCIRNPDGEALCACPEGYTGDRCDEVVLCGDAPDIAHGSIVSQTGQRYHDYTIYACDPEFMIQGNSSPVCQGNGEWERPPTCVHWLDYINPGVSGTPPSRRGRRGPSAHRRSQRHHWRNKRNAMPVTFEEMRAMFK